MNISKKTIFSAFFVTFMSVGAGCFSSTNPTTAPVTPTQASTATPAIPATTATTPTTTPSNTSTSAAVTINSEAAQTETAKKELQKLSDSINEDLGSVSAGEANY